MTHFVIANKRFIKETELSFLFNTKRLLGELIVLPKNCVNMFKYVDNFHPYDKAIEIKVDDWVFTRIVSPYVKELGTQLKVL
jgi:hypothetical protein